MNYDYSWVIVLGLLWVAAIIWAPMVVVIAGGAGLAAWGAFHAFRRT